VQCVSIVMHVVGHLAPHTGKTIFCLSIPLCMELPAWCLYTLYHVKIENKNILQLRNVYVTAARNIANKTSSIVENDRNRTKVGKYAGLHKSKSVNNLLSGVSRNEPNECMCQWI
jgi:hypothetical protein